MYSTHTAGFATALVARLDLACKRTLVAVVLVGTKTIFIAFYVYKHLKMSVPL